MPYQGPGIQPLDVRVAVITGTSGGITGGDIIPDGYIGVIRHISHAELTNTGQNVQLRTMPSTTNLDARALTPREKWPTDWAAHPDNILGYIPSNNALQVLTSQGNVVTRVTYTIELGRSSG